jgi:hypothetical protein
MHSDQKSTAAALQMYLLRREIERFNIDPYCFDDEEAMRLSGLRNSILREYYSTFFGENVLPLLAEPV